ncbi:MAG TPA: hypothetical protein VFT99_26385, partial [Roseiflexaceae bacterium]|nr:hypothetical protein [Roseiflexaceae bacterium]
IYESPDDATARTRLKEAGDAIAEVQASGVVTSTVDGRQRFEAMQREYDRARSAIQRISYFDDIAEVARNPLPGARFDSVIVPPPPRGITETETFGSVYILDADAAILYKQPRAGGPLQALLKSTDTFGPLSVGTIYGVAWRFDTIVAVTHSNEGGPYTYYFLNGNTWNYSILAGSEEWGRGGERFRIANYEGNLYVWGAQASQVLRYLSGQYGEFPLPWILDDGGKQFENALDISVDGKIYLLQPDGHVLVFSSDKGERSFEREIAPQGIEPPLTTVSRFFITGDSESGSIFLVDGYNSRIIQVDKATGEFVQQIKARPDGPVQLDNLLNVFVDTSTSRPMLYLVNGSQILRSALPDQPRPFREATGTPGATPESQASPTPEPTSSTP